MELLLDGSGIKLTRRVNKYVQSMWMWLLKAKLQRRLQEKGHQKHQEG